MAITLLRQRIGDLHTEIPIYEMIISSNLRYIDHIFFTTEVDVR